MTTFLQKIKQFFRRENIYDFISNDDILGLENFLKKGKSANEIDSFGQTPIFRILYNESEMQYKMLEIILDYGADVNFKKEDNTTPIFYGKKENAILLVRNGPNIYQKSNNNSTPLFNCNDITTLNYFLNLGLDINDRDINGATILHYLVYDDKNLVEFAVKNNAKINVQDNNGRTPLIYLAQSEYRNEEDQIELIEIAKILLDNGANPKHKDKKNLNVYDYCIEYENFGLESWLKKNCR